MIPDSEKTTGHQKYNAYEMGDQTTISNNLLSEIHMIKKGKEIKG